LFLCKPAGKILLLFLDCLAQGQKYGMSAALSGKILKIKAPNNN
jgi:hypothetical protein